ncbi:chemotaxis protein CheD [Caulobacter ginsengisoli]|uniref:Probable chemoreceptor glutamine deamidase CheD n=1 Tax=Caulobacter ginsengisoli TaxID=400775 RepID=A0ABU0IU55_9CAUL|nr:chemotaxis protein CheD [Caulobacter ginsengisoli]MDQ0465534.1 chemotaxis protein CheD [Caulobacter ginsengisoli]
MTSAESAFRKVHVIQGGHFVTDDGNVVLSTVLGSCVAACLRDPLAGIGGMNHFLLGESRTEGQADGEMIRYGAYAMEVLINGLMARGASRNRLEAKLFGGARMLGGLSDIGAANARFARKFLADEGIPLLGESLGGDAARRLEFWPVSGRVRQRLVSVQEVEQKPARAPIPAPAAADGGDLELF